MEKQSLFQTIHLIYYQTFKSGYKLLEINSLSFCLFFLTLGTRLFFNGLLQVCVLRHILEAEKGHRHTFQWHCKYLHLLFLYAQEFALFLADCWTKVPSGMNKSNQIKKKKPLYNHHSFHWKSASNSLDNLSTSSHLAFVVVSLYKKLKVFVPITVRRVGSYCVHSNRVVKA